MLCASCIAGSSTKFDFAQIFRCRKHIPSLCERLGKIHSLCISWSTPGPMQEIWKRDLLIQCLQGTLKEKYLAQVEVQPRTTFEEVWKELEKSYQIDNPHYWRDKWMRVQLVKYGENVSLKEWLLYRAAHEAARRQVSDYTTMEEVDMVLKQLPAGWRRKVIQQEAKENNNQYRVKLSGMPPNTTKAKVARILEAGRVKPSQIIEEKRMLVG